VQSFPAEIYFSDASIIGANILRGVPSQARSSLSPIENGPMRLSGALLTRLSLLSYFGVPDIPFRKRFHCPSLLRRGSLQKIMEFVTVRDSERCERFLLETMQLGIILKGIKDQRQCVIRIAIHLF